MLLYDLESRKKNTKSKNPIVVKAKNARIMLLSNCQVCDSKKLRFIKEQWASGTKGCLAKSLSKIPFVAPILF